MSNIILLSLTLFSPLALSFFTPGWPWAYLACLLYVVYVAAGQLLAGRAAAEKKELERRLQEIESRLGKLNLVARR